MLGRNTATLNLCDCVARTLKRVRRQKENSFYTIPLLRWMALIWINGANK